MLEAMAHAFFARSNVPMPKLVAAATATVLAFVMVMHPEPMDYVQKVGYILALHPGSAGTWSQWRVVKRSEKRGPIRWPC